MKWSLIKRLKILKEIQKDEDIRMSRDLTPYELHLLEQDAIKHGGKSLLDFTGNIVFHYKGEEVPYFSEADMRIRKQYPQLGKLLNHFEKVYDTLSKIDNGLDVLARCDQELNSYINTQTGDVLSPVIRWFKGELDSAFYYSETNDELFLEYMCKEAERMCQKKESLKESISPVSSLDGKIQSVVARSSENSKDVIKKNNEIFHEI